jgi:hypothetical protein
MAPCRTYLPILALALIGCVPTIHTSAIPSGGQRFTSTDRVRTSATLVPTGATELGIAEAHASGDVNIERLIPEFASEVGRLGGNFAKVDRISAKYEMHTIMQGCGPNGRMCAHQVEVPTFQVQGRAFLVTGGQP